MAFNLTCESYPTVRSRSAVSRGEPPLRPFTAETRTRPLGWRSASSATRPWGSRGSDGDADHHGVGSLRTGRYVVKRRQFVSDTGPSGQHITAGHHHP
jgi:hypothetical protein